MSLQTQKIGRLAWLASVFAGVCFMAGCYATPREPSTSNPSSQPVEAAQTQGGRWVTFRLAEAKDLRATLITRSGTADHFPVCTVQVYNVAGDDVVVGYEPACVVVHCGQYEQQGPATTFVGRREILRSQQPIEFELPPGSWAQASTTGARNLLIPSQLPSGKYPIWATFRIAGSDGPLVETPHDTYFVP